ncbi:MAG: hypothetical protein ACYDBH_14935 [Acidobacteriaceae bacterium]|jgi:hypothetical protein
MKAISLDLGGSHVKLAIIEDTTILVSQKISVLPCSARVRLK